MDDQINQKNVHEQDEIKKKENFQKKYSPEAIVRKQRLSWLGAFAAMLFIIPLAFSFNTKMHLEKEAKKTFEKRFGELF